MSPASDPGQSAGRAVAVAFVVLMVVSMPAMATAGTPPEQKQPGQVASPIGSSSGSGTQTVSPSAAPGAQSASSSSGAAGGNASIGTGQPTGDTVHTVLVFSNETGAPIERAAIENGTDLLARTDHWGHANLSEPPATVTVRREGYVPREVDLTGNHTDVGLEPAVPSRDTQFYGLHLFLYNQKTQTAISDGFAITMNKLEWRGETYSVPGDRSKYKPLIDDLETYIDQYPDSDWAKKVLDLLNGFAVTEQTAVPPSDPAAVLTDTTPSAEFRLPEGTYKLGSRTSQYEDTSDTVQIDGGDAIAGFYLEPKTGDIEITLDPDARGQESDPWEVEEFSIEIVKKDDGEVVKRDKFAPGNVLTDHGEFNVEGNQVTIQDYPAGTYDVTIRSPGFEAQPETFTDVEVPVGGTASRTADLVANETTLEVEVISSIYKSGGDELPLDGAPVSIEGQTGAAAGYTDEGETNGEGIVSFEDIPNGQYEVVVNETTVVADEVAAEFKPQSLRVNLGSSDGIGTGPSKPSPDLGEWTVVVGKKHKLVANLMPTTGHVTGNVVGNGSADLWPVVTWPNDDSDFDEEFSQIRLDDVDAEFEAEFDGHKLNLETDLIDEDALEWETTPLGVLYGDLPPGEYDIDLETEDEGNVSGGFQDRTIQDVEVNSSGTTVLSPDEDPADRASAEPIELDRAGDYVFGQLRVSIDTQVSKDVYNTTDYLNLSQFHPDPGIWGPLADAKLRFTKDNLSKTVTTNASGHFEPGYLDGGEWKVTIQNPGDLDYTFARKTFDLPLDGEGDLSGTILSAPAEEARITLDIKNDTGKERVVPLHIAVTNNLNNRSNCALAVQAIDCRAPLAPRDDGATDVVVPDSSEQYTVYADDKCRGTCIYHMFEEDRNTGKRINKRDDVEETDDEETEKRNSSVQKAALSGYVYDQSTWEPLENANVTFEGNNTETNSDGYFEFDERVEITTFEKVPDRLVTVRHETVTPTSFRNLALTPGNNRFDLYVERDAGTVKGTVTDREEQPVEDVRVVYEGNKTVSTGSTTTYTDSDGTFEFHLEAGEEENAPFTFDHPDLYPAKGEFDLDLEPDGTDHLPDGGAPIRINRTPSMNVTDISYEWADGGDIPDDTHALSGLATREELTEVELTVEVDRIPDDTSAPKFEPADSVEGEFDDYREWLENEDNIEKGTVAFDHTDGDWETRNRFDTEKVGDHQHEMTTELALAHVPVTHVRNDTTPVAVNVTVVTERNGTEDVDRTLGEGGTDDTNIYVNEPPRPLGTVLGDRLSKTAKAAIFAVDAVDFNGSKLGGNYPEITTDASYEGNISRDGTSGLEYEYELGFGLGFSVTEDLPESEYLLDTALMALPSEFALTEKVTVENEQVQSSVETGLGGTSQTLERWIGGLEWLSDLEVDSRVEIGYESTDEYDLPPGERNSTPKWVVDGTSKTTISANILELWPQLKPVAAAGVEVTIGAGPNVSAELSGERARDGDAYFGPIKSTMIKPGATGELSLGVNPGGFPVAEATGNINGDLSVRFEKSVTPTSVRLNGSIGASVNTLGYQNSWDIASGTILGPYNLTSESHVAVHHIDRERGFNLAYRLRDYHNVTGAQTGRVVGGAYPRANPQLLDGSIAYVHDDANDTAPPGSLGGRTLDVGSDSPEVADVGGPPLDLATDGGDGGDALVASHLPERTTYPAYPFRYLRDAGVSLIEGTSSGWSDPVELSAAGNSGMDLYPVLASTNTTHYVAWRSDRGVNPATTDDARLRFATVDRTTGAVGDRAVLESGGVVVPADIAATPDTVAVLGVTATGGPETKLTLHHKPGGQWDSTVISAGDLVAPDAAAVAIDPATGDPVVAWANGSAILIETPTGDRRVIPTDGELRDLQLGADGGQPALAWVESAPDGDGETVYHELLTGDPGPDVVTTTGEDERVSGLSIDVGDSRTNLTYAVERLDERRVNQSAGVDIGFQTERHEQPAFRIGIDGTNSPVREGETLVVNATVENTGAVAATREIGLGVDGTAVDATNVTLDGGETAGVTLTWETAMGDAGEYDAIVASENESESTLVTVQPRVPDPPPPAPPAPNPIDG